MSPIDHIRGQLIIGPLFTDVEFNLTLIAEPWKLNRVTSIPGMEMKLSWWRGDFCATRFHVFRALFRGRYCLKHLAEKYLETT